MTYIEKPKGHVVFDCDGTLISSFERILAGVADTMTIMLEREVTVDEAREKYVADLIEISSRFGLDPVGDHDLKEKLMRTWEEVAAKQTQPFALFPGIKELVLKVRDLGYQTYVWTARDRRSTLRILGELDIAQYFLEFRCLDDTTPKPHPAGLEEMVGDYDRSKIVVIGDSSTDLNGASSFGCQSIAACWAEDDLYEYLQRFTPTALAKTPQDCVELIENLIG
jgi:phosphoglycolate phosphatase